MLHDPVRVAEARGWLQKASGDLRAAVHDLAANPPLLDDAVFHCQQAAEKAFKGFLAWHDRPVGRTHNLEAIGEACLAVDPSLADVVDRAVPLTEYATRFRYPGEPAEPSRAEADGAVEAAREVFDSVLARLPAEVGS
jgi:HEPN domain-containing protein